MSQGAGGTSTRTRRSRPGAALMLGDMEYGRAFTGLATGDPTLDGFLPLLRDLHRGAARRREAMVDPGRGPLWDAVEALAERCQAPPATRPALASLRAGAPVVCTGQQPGLLGGPIFILYKAATAIHLARDLERALGEPVVPIFWVAADDSDFKEVARATLATADLKLETVAIDPALEDPTRMVGGLAVTAGRDAARNAAQATSGLPYAALLSELAGATWERGRDWGEGFAAVLYALLGEHGLVVVDAREPVLRDLARPLLTRYLDDVAGYAQVVDRAGEALAADGLGRQLGTFAARFPLYEEEPPYRLRLADPGGGEEHLASFATRARAVMSRGGALWTGVALRPLVVDTTLPVVARVLGPAEVAYMAQLSGAYAHLDVVMPPLVPRLTGTLVPARSARVAAATVGGLPALVRDPAATLSAYYKRQLPLPARRALEELEGSQRAGYARAREALAALGRGLDQLVDSVATKADFQLARLWQAAIKRERKKREADEPFLRHLAPFLRPDQGLQERRLATLSALALAGPGLVSRALEMAESDLALLRAGRGEHHLLEFDP